MPASLLVGKSSAAARLCLLAGSPCSLSVPYSHSPARQPAQVWVMDDLQHLQFNTCCVPLCAGCRVPAAKEGRDSPEWDIFGMAGVPEGMKPGDEVPKPGQAAAAAQQPAGPAAATMPPAAPVLAPPVPYGMPPPGMAPYGAPAP